MKTAIGRMKQMLRRLGSTGERMIRCSALLGLLALALMSVQSALAQGITGSITGTVTDSTGAAIPDATVIVRGVATNSVHTVKTSDAGSYTVPQLPPGQYTVTVDKAAFKSYKQSAITLLIDQVAQIDAQLTIGATNDIVEVTSAEPVIQTSSSSVGSVIDSQAIQNTPLNGRLGINGLVALAPGVQGAGAQDQLDTRGVTASVGTGARSSYGGLGSTLDGVTNQEVTLQRGEGEVPSLDAIAEFKILTTGAPAEFNQPAQIIVVSASGTNAVHGGAFEFNRSKGTAAKAYSFLAPSLVPARPPYQRNEYGGNLSGPIVIPHFYNGRDKSFFFAAYEGFRLTQSYSDNTQEPSILQRQGIFTESSTPIINPATQTAFAGNIIPSSYWNSVDVQLLKLLYPVPTISGTGVNTYEQVQETSHASRFSLRLDHKLTDKDQLRFTYLRAFYGPSPTNGNNSLQGGNALDGEHNQNFIVGWTHTFSPTLLLDVAGSYFHLPIYRTPQNHNTDFSSIIPGLGTELIEGAPQITITNIQSVSESGSHDLEQDAQVATSLTKVLSKHTLKAGFSYLYNNHWNDSAESPQRGSFAFTGHYSGNAVADFLLGDPISTGNATPNNYIVRNLSSQYGLYLQDDWKALSNLTINAGLRYDLQWFQGNPYGNESLYVPSLGKVVVFGHSYPAAAIPSFLTSIPITLSSQVGLPNSAFGYLGQDKHNVAPRFGFAYEPVHNTVIRGAVGLYFTLLPSNYVDTAPFGTLPFVSSETYSNSSGTTPAFTMSNPFSATGAFTANPSVSAQAKTTTPYTEEYNLAIEHQLPRGVDVRIGYVGQHNLKQNNYGGPGSTPGSSVSGPNLNLPSQPVLIANGSATVQSTYLVQPFATINNSMAPMFHSNMNSLQIGVHKQYSHGLAFGAEYQWTRVLGTENIENPSGSTPNDSYGPISGLTPQVLTVNYSYLLPFGKGQAFLGSAGNLVDKIVSGWQISGISTFQTGQPFSVTYTAPGKYQLNSTTTYSNLVSGRANRVPGASIYPSRKTKAEWFNPTAFTAPTNAAGVKGGAYGNSGYDMLRGPGFQNWDMNLQKNISFKERYKLQLRADSFNVFNHPNFTVGTSNASLTSSSVGTITSTTTTPSYEARTVEFAAKFSF
ncbi:TonB-dependent receptor [Granulicella arctica]|uniref:TonB-dependent transporter Oar-like beta-barrel domain-containing protein n=1 Tax=Granulicella arctica TaxID=940613 RepID=A0A7Y9TH85_9BACT|nr:TonB-dependent receptor [Granulicella arctica]NYF79600.1 hypothetical protein [Granulicella arctica]